MSALHLGASAADFVTHGAMSVILGALACLASSLPARQASLTWTLQWP